MLKKIGKYGMILLLWGVMTGQLRSGVGDYDYVVQGSALIGLTVVSGLNLSVTEIETVNEVYDSGVIQINFNGMSDFILVIENDSIYESEYLNLHQLKNIPVEFEKTNDTSITIYYTSY